MAKALKNILQDKLFDFSDISVTNVKGICCWFTVSYEHIEILRVGVGIHFR